jgi:hypothetical protein
MNRISTSHRDWFLSCLRSRNDFAGHYWERLWGELWMPVNKVRTFLISLLIAVGCGVVAAPATLAREREWQPQRTGVFVVGTLKWKHSDVFGSFPQKNRRDAQLVDFFRQQGVPANQLIYLQDAQATTQRVKTSFPAFLSRAQEGDLLFFFYCGHGYRSDDERTTFFATYDAGENVEGWSTESVVGSIEKYFKGSQALLTADSCYSGSLAEQARRASRRISYASLTSASADELSTENWTFTEMLLAGLTGKAFADSNEDGQITLGEVAEGVKQDMAFAEEQGAAFVAKGSLGLNTVLAEAKPRSSPDVSRRVEVKSEGDWYKARIIDARAGRFKVHYYGWDDSDDEWILPGQIRKSKSEAYGDDTMVEVNWQGQWYSAQILKVDRGSHLIHYVGYDDSWDEWVSARRIRRR